MSQAPTAPVHTSTPAPGGAAGASAGSEVEQVTRAAVQEISHIATLPEVTMKIIKLVESPDSTAQDLNQVISHDPALGTRILKVVNSAFYGLPGQIGSINRAIVLLGLNAVKNIAIAASLAKLFRGGKICPSFDARDLWGHCIASAAATRLLAKQVGLGLPDEAFLAGLIHDLGIMVEVQARRPQFIQAIEKAESEGLTLRAAETACLGANHEQFGAELCRVWKFPTSFAYVTGFHHHPADLAVDNRTLTSLVAIADVLAVRAGIGMAIMVERDTLDPAQLNQLNLSTAQVDEVIADLPAAMEEAKVIFQAA